MSEKKYEITTVRAGDVRVPDYQRGVVARSRRIEKEYKPELVGVPVLSLRSDGHYWVIDGLQRVSAIKAIFGVDHPVGAQVFYDLTPREEVDMFVELNRETTRVSAFQLYKAQLSVGDKRAVGVRDVTEAQGFKVNVGGGSHSIAAVTALNNAYDIGPEHLAELLETYGKAWPHHPTSPAERVLRGLSLFLDRYRGQVPAKDLAGVLQKHSTPDGLIASAGVTAGGGSGSTATGVFLAIRDLWNKRRPSRMVS